MASLASMGTFSMQGEQGENIAMLTKNKERKDLLLNKRRSCVIVFERFVVTTLTLCS
jgi:hypothetical protein